MVFIPVWLVLCLLFRPDFSSVTWGSLLLAIPAVILGFAINFLFGAAITCLAFWTTRVYSLMEFYCAMAVLFSGQFVPLALMPPVIQPIAKFLPFQFFMYFPISAHAQPAPARGDPAQFRLGRGLAGHCPGVLFLLVWRAGVKRFSAVGA